ncbi:hypothetical protein ASF74_00020 [Arthrobacter sp. Leaf145]|nr:hypothetical protein ASF74_00020 [Arthrobacter sp. Leaf145]
MGAALGTPRNRFRNCGHRPAVVGFEMRPRRQRQSQYLSGTDVAEEIALTKFKMGPGDVQ